MVRDPSALYKFGRSTNKQMGLGKFKRWKDAEGRIVGFNEELKNDNEKKIDLLGYSKRSSDSENKTFSGTLGSFECQSLDNPNVFFSVGTGIGLTKKLKQEIYNNRDEYLGKTISFKFFSYTPDGLPRFASFRGFREDV
jgi:DNA ligase 1